MNSRCTPFVKAQLLIWQWPISSLEIFLVGQLLEQSGIDWPRRWSRIPAEQRGMLLQCRSPVPATALPSASITTSVALANDPELMCNVYKRRPSHRPVDLLQLLRSRLPNLLFSLAEPNRPQANRGPAN